MSPLQEYQWSLKDLARYPFLEEAKEYISEEGPSLEELMNSRIWGASRRRGKDRVLESLEEGEVSVRDMGDEIEQEEELFSYPLARMLVSSVGDEYLVRRYTLAESERISNELYREDDSDLLNFASKLGFEVDVEEDHFKVHFTDYLESSERLKSSEWKLVNQDLRKGYVHLERKRLIRIMKEKVTSIVSEGLPAPVSDDILEAFEAEIEQIEELLEERRAEIEEVDMGEVENELFPPCIKKLLGGQKEGENLSHEGRFALTAFLKKVGLSEEDIMEIFQEAPDFDRELAEYQIEHIIGELSGKEYMPPGCDTMKTNGICFDPDSLCEQEWMSHPLSYYSVKKNKEENE